ncbi:hypothetical protein H632_c1196p0, partial [Helicosporidium sp. ATCC 50920]
MRRLSLFVARFWPCHREFRLDAMRVVAHPHYLLATLLLCNACAMEALPLFLDRLLNPWAAILLSVSAILIFGEIVPQAICKRYGLQVGAHLAPLVRTLMLVTGAVTYPIAVLLDATLGEESARFRKAELRALVSLHAEPEPGASPDCLLSADEVQVIQGALDMAAKTAVHALTPLDKVFALPEEALVDESLLRRVIEKGHSRVPVFRRGAGGCGGGLGGGAD